MSIQRYDIQHSHDQGSEMTEQADGGFVRYEDVAPLIEFCKRTRRVIETTEGICFPNEDNPAGTIVVKFLIVDGFGASDSIIEVIRGINK